MPLIDPASAINKIFREGRRPVPYPVFMNCLNRLIKDARTLEPCPPSEELKEFFRAACMAVDLGIADKTSRAEDRTKEFMEHVWPAWEEALPEAEFKPYQEIIGGERRQLLERTRQEEQTRRAEEAADRSRREESRTSLEEMRPMIAKAARAAIAALGGDEEEEAQNAAIGPQAAAIGPHAAATGPHAAEGVDEEELALADTRNPTPPAGGKIDGAAPVSGGTEETIVESSIVKLANAIESGQVPVRYATRRPKTPYARFGFRDQSVAVQPIASGGSYYILMSYAHGVEDIKSVVPIIRNVLTGLGYVETEPVAYEKMIGMTKHKVRIGLRGMSLAQKHSAPLGAEEFSHSLTGMLAELVEMVDAIDRKLKEPPSRYAPA